MGRTATDPNKRWWSKVDRRGDDECWPWIACRFDNGYGAFRLGNKQVKAHRFGYEALVGPIPGGMFVCHSCDNPPCQNPAHWFLGSPKDNSVDRERKGRGRFHHFGPLPKPVLPGKVRGERNHLAKLTEENVREIRRRYLAGESQQRIADSLGVSQKNISCIVQWKTWTHVA